MLKNYFHTAIRSFKKNKVYTLISVLSLSFGITCCLTQFAILRHEFTFDSFHKQKDQIYRVVEHEITEKGMKFRGILPSPLPKTLEANLFDSEMVIPMFGPVHANIKINSAQGLKVFTDPRILYTNSSFLANLDFDLIEGGPAQLLDEKGTLFLTEKMAEKYFGKLNPLGQTIKVDDMELTVRGILEDHPTNTNVPFNCIISDLHVKDNYDQYASNWDSYWAGSTYIVKKESSSVTELEAEINQIYKQNLTKEQGDLKQLYLQPLSEAHTDDRYAQSVNYVPPTTFIAGSILMVVLILIVSVLNFINLATGQSIIRSKEVGIRKTLGGKKRELIFQFLSETFLLVSAATLIGLTLGQVLMDLLNSAVSGMSFHVGYDQTIILFIIGLILFVTLLGGAYPALVLSRFNPIKTLHNQVSLSRGSGSFSLRKIMISSQFVIANFLIICTIVSISQMDYIQSKNLGFNSENVTIIEFSDQSPEKMQTILNEYQKLNFVEKASNSFAPPQTGSTWYSSYQLPNQEANDQQEANVKFVDQNYLDLYDIDLLYGRNLTNSYSTDSTTELVVNKEFVDRLGLTYWDALQTKLVFEKGMQGIIVGITDNFHVSKLNRADIQPIAMAYVPRLMNEIHLKLTDNHDHYAELENVFRQFDQENLFEPGLLSHRIERSYSFEKIIFRVIVFFSITAIIISLMGLYGLVSFMIAKNQKPLSIRKIFGASTNALLIRFSWEYLVLIVIAFIISTPLSGLVMQQWLNNFYFHIDLSFWHFFTGLLVITTISLLTVGVKSYKAANTNPADILRHE